MSLLARLLVVVTLIALGACAAGAQVDSLPPRLAPAVRLEILRLADSLRMIGLPAEVLHSKAREGVLRGVDDARILTAVQAVAQRLLNARAVLGIEASRDEIVSAADALSAGISPSALRRLRDDLPTGAGRPLATAFVVLADLVTRGVPTGIAIETVRSLTARGMDGTSLMRFREGVELDIRSGRAPGEATAAHGRSLIERWDASQLRRLPDSRP